MIRFYKYSGAGNDFVVVDGRHDASSSCREAACISAICDRKTGFAAADGRIGADGFMILSLSQTCDFRMEFFNPDGSGGMMCGNGGRCIVAFADHLGLRPSGGKVFRFEAGDGLHTGEILSRDGVKDIVRIKMIDVHDFRPLLGGWFVDTGTRHFVKFVPDAEKVDIESDGRQLRWHSDFAPVGVNANFVSIDPDGALRVRTFEKGVEAETLACGTGITASAIAAYMSGVPASSKDGNLVHFDIQARQDRLAVDFIPCGPQFASVYLTGPALLVEE